MMLSCSWMGLVWLLFVLGALPTFGADCAEIERRLDARLSSLAVSADELGAFRGLGKEALEGLKSCPESARLWYLAARCAEVLEVPMAGAAFPHHGGAKAIALDAAKHAPGSAPIATILARSDGTRASAQRAHDLDPNYGPACRALALALAKEGSFEEALRLLKVSGASSADRIARARVLLSAGRPAAAASEAKRALKPLEPDASEPTTSSELFRDGDEVHGFALLALGRKKQAVRALRSAAALGSRAAQIELDNQSTARR